MPSKINGVPVGSNDEWPVEDATINLGVRLADLLAGKNFDGVEFDAFETYAYWSDLHNSIMVKVIARRKLTPAEMGRLAHLCNTASPGRSANDVYEDWAATLETPIEYYGDTVVPANSIFVNLLPMR